MSDHFVGKRKGILLEHREEYRALYGLNLYVYLGIQPLVCSTVREVIETIKRENTVDLIFVDNNSYSVDVGIELYNYLCSKGLDDIIPYFIVGRTKTPSMHVTVFDTNMQLKYILQSVAKTLEVTAKEMATQNSDPYFPLPLEFILPGWQCASSVYRKEGANYVEIFGPEEVLICDLIEELEESGTPAIYIDSTKRLRFVNSLTLQISAKLNDPNLAPEDRMKTTARGYQMVMEQVRKIGVTQTTMDIANDCIESMNTIVDTAPNVGALLKDLMESQGTYRYQHSLMTLYIGSHIIKNMTWGNREQMEKLAFMAFFHDIALTTDEMARFRSDKEVMQSALSEKDKKKVLYHAMSAAKLVSKIQGVPFGVESLLKQHHGSKDGRTLSKISVGVSPLAIVFIFAEEWTDLVFQSVESDKKPDKQKIIQQLHRKYDLPAFNKILPVLHSLEI